MHYALGRKSALLKLGVQEQLVGFEDAEAPVITEQKARQIGRKLNVDFSKYPLEQFRDGIQTEFEHTKKPMLAGEISEDHLKESPRYYTELKKMEDRLKREA